MRQLKFQLGLTLIELLVTMSVMAGLLAAAVPFAGDYVVNGRLHQAGTVVLADALFAQSEGVKRNARVSLEVSGASLQVVDRSQDPPQVLRSRRLPDGVLTSGDALLAFGSAGRPVPLGTEYAVSISPPGGACDGNRRCPVLHVQAGGAMNLCIAGGTCL